MGFFNKKEDVLHIELTPHGRYLLSIGKLLPSHYRFFDDDSANQTVNAELQRRRNSKLTP